MKTLLNTREIAEELGVSTRWIQREMAGGGLPHQRIGSSQRLVRFDRDAVLAWARQRHLASDEHSDSRG